MLDLQLEQERIQPNLAHLRPPLELLLHVAGHVGRDQPGNEEEADERVGQDQDRQHRDRDEKRGP